MEKQIVKKIGYIRVSTNDQNPDRQLHGIELDERFIDYFNGSSKERPALIDLFRYIRPGDTVYVHELDRLGRTLTELKALIKELIDKKVKVHFLAENIIFDGEMNAMAEFQLHMLGAFSQYEKSIIAKRRQEGIARAKEKGLYKGRAPILDERKIELIKTMLEKGFKVKEIASQMNVAGSTIYKYLKGHKKKVLFEKTKRI